MRDVVVSAEDELVDLTREYEKYIRKDSFWDQLNRGNRLMIISFVLLAYCLTILVTSLMGLL
jgi:hypothetical protein